MICVSLLVCTRAGRLELRGLDGVFLPSSTETSETFSSAVCWTSFSNSVGLKTGEAGSSLVSNSLMLRYLRIGLCRGGSVRLRNSGVSSGLSLVGGDQSTAVCRGP